MVLRALPLQSSSSLALPLPWPSDRGSVFPVKSSSDVFIATENVASDPVVASMLIFPLAFKLVGHEGVTKNIYRHFCGQ